MSIGTRIKFMRKKLGYSAEELGELIGKDRATIYRYEKGDIENLPYSVIEPLSNALKVTPAFLMGWQHDSIDGYISDIIRNTRISRDFTQEDIVIFSKNKLNLEQVENIENPDLKSSEDLIKIYCDILNINISKVIQEAEFQYNVIGPDSGYYDNISEKEYDNMVTERNKPTKYFDKTEAEMTKQDVIITRALDKMSSNEKQNLIDLLKWDDEDDEE